MKLKRILPFARNLLATALEEGAYAVDATVGNGHDTLYLANLVGDSGHVFGFDIQKEAIDSAAERLAKEDCLEQVTLFQKSHSTLKNVIPEEAHGKIKAAIFNLGYLPGGNKEIVTQPDSTISAIEQLLDLMAAEGIIVLVIYHGHMEGQVERDALLNYVTSLNQHHVHVLKYQFLNQQNNPPFIVALEKR